SLIALIGSVSGEGLEVLNTRGLWEFINQPFSIRPANTGVYQGIVGTVTSAVLVAAFAFPLGVAA
ncbi:MAG: hypothetical protein KDA97_01845, partial [Acidimicrobiales bacterium]|nr:hypothetical protein [Acidimicrobiales bacterium]